MDEMYDEQLVKVRVSGIRVWFEDLPGPPMQRRMSDKFLLDFLDSMLPEGYLWEMKEEIIGLECQKTNRYRLVMVQSPGSAGACNTVREALCVAVVAKEFMEKIIPPDLDGSEGT